MASLLDYTATLYYTQEDELWKHEKPYHFKYPNPEGPDGNTAVDMIENVVIHDIRGREEQFSLADHGFMIMKVPDELSYEDYHDQSKVQPYFRQLEKNLKRQLGASRVWVFRHAIRKRAAEWPIADEKKVYDYDQPTTLVHIDATLEGCKQEIAMHYGREKRDVLCRGRFQWFNFWKPLRTTEHGLMDWPLNFCDASTIDKHHDLEAADLIYPNYATENTQVYYRPKHEWYYLSGQTTDEVIVFKQADSDLLSCAGVPHCSAFNPLSRPNEPLRESIEVRAFAFYDDWPQ